MGTYDVKATGQNGTAGAYNGAGQPGGAGGSGFGATATNNGKAGYYICTAEGTGGVGGNGGNNKSGKGGAAGAGGGGGSAAATVNFTLNTSTGSAT